MVDVPCGDDPVASWNNKDLVPARTCPICHRRTPLTAAGPEWRGYFGIGRQLLAHAECLAWLQALMGQRPSTAYPEGQKQP